MTTVYMTIRVDVEPERVVGVHPSPEKAWAQMEKLSKAGNGERAFAVERAETENVRPGLNPNSIIVKSERGISQYLVAIGPETRKSLLFHLF